MRTPSFAATLGLLASAGVLLAALPRPALADPAISCPSCVDTRPSHLKIDLASCPGGPAKKTEEIGGRLLRLGAPSADHSAHLWMGITATGKASSLGLYVAYFPAGKNQASRCLDLGSLDDDAAGDLEAATSAARGVRITASLSSACFLSAKTWVVGDLALGGGLKIVSTQKAFDDGARCVGNDPADQKKYDAAQEALDAGLRRAAALRRQGLAALHAKRFAAAESLLRKALALARANDGVVLGYTVLDDIGELLAQRGRKADAEAMLVDAVLEGPRRAKAWLDLADLYWGAGRKALAGPLYRRYLTALAGETEKGSKVPPEKPVARAITRAAPAPAAAPPKPPPTSSCCTL